MSAPLTRHKRKILAELSDDWATMPDDWKASRALLDLIDEGYAEWREQRRGYSTVRVGPGAHGGYFWQVRRAPLK